MIRIARLWLLFLCLSAASCPAAIYYVDASRPDDSGAATNWATAKRTIQPAVNLAVPDDTVLVAPGAYALTTTLVVTNRITVASSDGAALTVINGQGAVRCVRLSGLNTVLDGFTVTGGRTNRGAGIYGEAGSAILNCIVTSNQAVTAVSGAEVHGGGLYVEGGRVSNCIIRANSAKGGPGVYNTIPGGDAYGGGLYATNGGTITDTRIDENAVVGGNVGWSGDFRFWIRGGYSYGGGLCLAGAQVVRRCVINTNVNTSALMAWGQGAGAWISGGSMLADCAFSGNLGMGGMNEWVLGGGLYLDGESLGDRCTFSNNRIDYNGGGGGIYAGDASTIRNCLLSGNSAIYYGGGVQNGTVENCTIVSNTVYATSGVGSGGTMDSVVVNSILQGNRDGEGLCNQRGGTVNFSCTLPDPGGTGNITNDPVFVDAGGDYHLRAGSPCINAGTNQDWMTDATDLDGNPRILGGRVDMGCYEQAVDAGVAPPAISAPVAVAPGGSNYYAAAEDNVWVWGVKPEGNWVLGRNAEGGFRTNGILQEAGGTWWSNRVDLGQEVLTLEYRGSTNNWGAPAGATSTVLTVEYGHPVVSITTPSGTLPAQLVTYGVQGVNNEFVRGQMSVSNAATGELEWFAAPGYPQTAWTSPPVTLVMGTNRLTVCATNTLGEKATDEVELERTSNTIHYVAWNSANPAAPYLSWETAATSIQAAVDSATYAHSVVISDGTYRVSAPVTVLQGIEVRSVNGPALTIVDAGGTGRVFFVDHAEALVEGLTITGGHTTNSGAGVYCRGALLRGCVIAGNRSQGKSWGHYEPYPGETGCGGGVHLAGGGAVESSLIISNSAVGGNGGSMEHSAYGGGNALGGGLYSEAGGVIRDCMLAWNMATGGDGGYSMHGMRGVGGVGQGGGLYVMASSVVERCIMRGNRSTGSSGWHAYGGGLYAATGTRMENSLLVDNRATGGADYMDGGSAYGGGVYGSGNVLLRNCTCVTNVAEGGASVLGGPGYSEGGGIYLAGGTAENTILYHNAAKLSGSENCATGVTLLYSCATPSGGTGGITNDPIFVDRDARDCRLLAASPCINAGTNQDWMADAVDLDGRPRILGGRVDMGCYEFPVLSPPELLGPVAVSAGGSGLYRTTNTEVWVWGTKATSCWAGVSEDGGAYTTNGIQQTYEGGSWSNLLALTWTQEAQAITFEYQCFSNADGYVFTPLCLSSTVLRVTRLGLGSPSVEITSDRTRLGMESNCTLEGLKNGHVVGTMWASNAANGAVVTFDAPAGDVVDWTAPPLALLHGTNVLWAFGSNVLGVWASDSLVVEVGPLGYITLREADAQVQIDWDAQLGRLYQWQQSSDLVGDVWSNVGDAFVPTQEVVTLLEPASEDTPRFFRIIYMEP